jgi:transcriptional regulator with XRE-family HTH domain
LSPTSGAPSEPEETEESVGAALARMRRERGWTGAELASRIGMSQPKISRIERDRGTSDPGDIGVVARALGADEAVAQALTERAERAHGRLAEWLPATPTIAGRQRTLADWESATEVVRNFEPVLLTGLLQTSGYARAVLRAIQGLHQLDAGQPSEQVVRAAVAARIKRQEVIADRAKTFRFVITEAVLRNEICPAEEMLAQVSVLLELTERQDNVLLGIIPDGTRVEVPPLHGFTLYDDRMVLIDVFSTGLSSRARADLASYRTVFDRYERHVAADSSPILRRYREYYIDRLRPQAEPTTP